MISESISISYNIQQSDMLKTDLFRDKRTVKSNMVSTKLKDGRRKQTFCHKNKNSW